MSDLIEALRILLKYGDPLRPTCCHHGEFTVCGVNPDDVIEEDKLRLKELGFFISSEDECFRSYRFGSC